MKILKSNVAVFLYAFLSFFFLNFEIENNTIVLLKRSEYALEATCIVAFLLLLFRILIRRYPQEHKREFYILAAIISSFFSFVSVMGVIYPAELSISIKELITGSMSNVFRFLLVFLGGFLLFYLALVSLGAVKKTLGLSQLFCCVDAFLFGKRSFLKIAGIIFICWLPYLLIRYPAAMPLDDIKCLLQYYGVDRYTTQHPIIYTLLLGYFCDLGAYISNIGFGIFLLMLLQVIISICSLTYTIRVMERLKVPHWCCLTALVIFSIVPVFPGYAVTLIVDVFYCTAILLLMNELALYLFLPEEYKNLKHLSLTSISILGMFFRNNGFHVICVILVFLVLLFFIKIRKKEQTIRCSLIILAFFLIPLCVGKMNNNRLHDKYHAQSVSARAMLALPMQQVARCMISYGNELEQEDVEALQKVLTWEISEYKDNYDPYKFDTIKRKFNVDATKEEIKGFLKIWLKLLINHPDTCINATLHQNYLLFSPLEDNYKYYGKIWEGLELVKEPDFISIYENQKKKSEINSKLTNFSNALSKAPFMGLYVNQGVMTLLLFGICLYALTDRNYSLLFLALPMLLTLAVNFVAPAVDGNPRYYFPIFYAMPLLFGIFLTGQGNRLSQKGEGGKR